MRTCVHCHEAIATGERAWRFAGGPLAHRVCAFRMVIGSVAHVEQRCACYVPGAHDGDPEGLTRHGAAEAAVEAWRRRARARRAED